MFNRFDIAAAYNHFTANFPYADKQLTIKVECYLLKWKYKPGISDSKLSTISSNAKEIYMILVRKYFN